jgi:hypothetical protein
MVQPLTVRYVSADFLTSSHHIFGQIKVGQTGVTGLLSDPRNSHIEINDASLARIQQPDKVINYAQMLWLVKSQVVAVCIHKREYAGSTAVLRAGYTQVFPYHVEITTSIFEVTGTLDWSGRFDFSALMTEGTNAFILLYDALITSSFSSDLHIDSQLH